MNNNYSFNHQDLDFMIEKHKEKKEMNLIKEVNDLDQIQKALNEMDNSDISIVNQNDQLLELEKIYHGKDLYFGDVIEFEIDKIIPALRMKFKDHKEFSRFLKTKEIKLKKLKENIIMKIKAGQIDEDDYFNILKHKLNSNKKILEKAAKSKIDETHVKRIKVRIKVIQKEIDSIMAEINVSQVYSQIKPKQSSKVRKKQSEEEDKSLKIGSVYLKNKIRIYKSFLTYLQQNFSTKRNNEIKELEGKIEQMNQLLEKEEKEISIDEIDKLYPKLSADQIIGMSKTIRDKIIEKIFDKVKGEINQIRKDKPFLLNIYNRHYINILKELKKVKLSSYGILPELKTRVFMIPINQNINALKKLQIEVSIPKISSNKNIHSLEIEISDYDRVIKEVIFIDDLMKKNYHQIFDLDKNQIKRKQIVKVNLKNGKGIVTRTYQLDDDVNKFEEDFNQDGEFEEGLKFELNFNVLKFYKGKTVDLELLELVKVYPIFKIPKRVRKQENPYYFEPTKPGGESEVIDQKNDDPNKIDDKNQSNNMKQVDTENDKQENQIKKPDNPIPNSKVDKKSLIKKPDYSPPVCKLDKMSLIKKSNYSPPMSKVDKINQNSQFDDNKYYMNAKANENFYNVFNSDFKNDPVKSKYLTDYKNKLSSLIKDLEDTVYTKEDYIDFLKKNLLVEHKYLRYFKKQELSDPVKHIQQRLILMNKIYKKLKKTLEE